jgi:DNA-binding transcriptional MocR family regulator
MSAGKLDCMDWRPDLHAAARPLYLALVDQLAEDIRQRRLLPGTRLPTHRELAKRLRLDVTTVSRAYAEARRRGLIAGHVGRGTFVRGPLHRPDRDRDGLIDLTMNIPPDDNPLVRKVVSSLLGQFSRGGSRIAPAGYAPIGGRPEDRATAAEWLAHHGLSVRADRVLVAACAQQAFVAILSVHCEPGDVVLTEWTTYPGFAAAARLLRLNLVGVDGDRTGIDPASFERLCRRHRPKVLILVPTLQNPTGITLSAGRRARLAAVARRHGVMILEDDAYGPLHRTPPRPIADIAPDVTYLVATASKLLLPMMRWCAIAAPTPLLAARVESSLRATGWMQSALESVLARDILSSPAATAILNSRRRDAEARMAIARRVLGTTAIAATNSGHHAWLELPRRWTAREFTETCRQHGVLVSPGEEFAIDPTRAMRAVRVCLGAAASLPELEGALRTIADTLQRDPVTTQASH